MILSDPAILIVATALNVSDAERALEFLKDISLPNATKYVVAPGKIDAGKQARAFNIDSGYPRAPAHLQTLGAWAARDRAIDDCFRDAYDLFCLRSLLAKNSGFDVALLIGGLADAWLSFPRAIADRLFLTFSAEMFGESVKARPNIAFNLRDDRSTDFLEVAWELFETGAAYAIAPYSFETVLCTAQGALGIADDFRAGSQRGESPFGADPRHRPSSPKLRPVLQK